MNLINRIHLFHHFLDNIPVIEPAIPCEVSSLAESELARLHEVWPVPLEEMKTRLERGDLCFVAIAEGRVAHYSWAQFSGLHEIRDVGQRVEVQRGHVWVYHCRTADWARARQIYPFVLTRLLAESKSRNCHAAWIYTSAENIASLRGIEKAGFSFYRQLVSLNLFGSRFPISSI